MFHGLENGPTTKSSSMVKEVLLEWFLINGLFCYFFLVIEIFSLSVYEKKYVSGQKTKKKNNKKFLLFLLPNSLQKLVNLNSKQWPVWQSLCLSSTVKVTWLGQDNCSYKINIPQSLLMASDDTIVTGHLY